MLNRNKSGFSGRASNSSAGSTDARTSIFHSTLFQTGNLIKVLQPQFLVLGEELVSEADLRQEDGSALKMLREEVDRYYITVLGRSVI